MKATFLLKQLTSALIVILFLVFKTSAQKTVDVNLLTGTAQVNIPIYNVIKGDLSSPISLSYSAKGIKAEDYNFQYGLGWNLNAKWSVARTVKGFPDDIQYQGGTSFSTIYGWLRGGAANIGTKIENFSIANDLNPSTCSDEVTDYSYMNTNIPDNYDSEPDIFSINAPGLSLQFVFDKNMGIKTIPYADVVISYSTNGLGKISSFSVTNDKGIKYTFDKPDSATKAITDQGYLSTLQAFRRDFLFYRKDANGSNPGSVSYSNEWSLSSMTDVKGNKIIFSYDLLAAQYRSVTPDYVNVYNGNNVQTILYSYGIANWCNRLKKISVINGATPYEAFALPIAEFFWADNIYSTAQLQYIRLYTEAQRVNFSYFNLQNSNPNAVGRSFLKKIEFTRETCESLGDYQFTYTGAAEGDANSFFSLYYVEKAQDYWGYFNNATSNTNIIPPIWVYPDNSAVSKYKIAPIPGYSGNVVALTGANRNSSSEAVNGSLNSITYPTGGVTTLAYELNQYWDKDINAAVSGGGIRIKSIQNNDGQAVIETINYEYNDPSTGLTTGRATSLPAFCFAFPNSTTYSTVSDKVINSTYRTEYNLSNESNDIIYGKVTVKKSGAGKSVYEYSTTATWGSSATGDWYETQGYVTRKITSAPNPCGSILPDFLSNDKYAYPFAQNPNYDFERGLLTKVSHYNESSQLVAEEAYSYTRSHASATKIKALKFDDYLTVRGYAKYDIITTVDNLPLTKTVKAYNSSNPSSGVNTTETENYYYSAIVPNLLSRVEKQNSDGVTYKSYFHYAKDFTTTGSGDLYEQAIHNLKSQNNNALLETWQSVTPDGGTEKTIAADLTTYKVFTNGASNNMYLPYESWKFVSQAGVTDFSQSNISSNSLWKYSGYYKNSSIYKYDMNGYLMSATDNSRVYKTSIRDYFYNLPIATVANAKPEEIIYQPFDFASIQVGGTASVQTLVAGQYSGRASSGGGTLNSTATNFSISNAATNKYVIFSCWLKDASANGYATIVLTPNGGTGTNYTINFTTGSSWKYYEVKMAKPAYPTYTTLSVSVTASVSVSVDDILIYPDNAEISTNSYIRHYYGTETTNAGNFLTAQTGTKGVTKYYQYDNMGRVATIKDKEENIVQTKQYRKVNSWNTTMSPTISWSPQPGTVSQAVTFTIGNLPCSGTDFSFVWNFGDGTGNFTTSSPSTTHSYSTAGGYVVTCTVSALGFSPVTVSTPALNDPSHVTINSAGVSVVICAAGIVELNTSCQCVLNYCPPLSAVCTDTKFQIVSLSGANTSDIASYTWEKTLNNTNNWSTVGTGSTLTINFYASTTLSYQVRLKITLNNSQQVTSNVMTILNNCLE